MSKPLRWILKRAIKSYSHERGECARERRTAQYKSDDHHSVWLCEPVWPSGKALGWSAKGPRVESASALLSLQKLWSVDTVL